MNFPVYKADAPRRHLKDGKTKLWPERNHGLLWREGRITEEVEKALMMVRRAPQPKPRPSDDGVKYTYQEAAAILGISPAGVLKRVRKHGWAAAMAMGGARAT